MTDRSLVTWGVGRRSLYLYGLCGLFSMLLIMGFLGLVGNAHRDQAALATGSLMIVWALFYQLSVGTVCYSLVAELSTRRLQIKTVVLGRNLYNVAAIITNVLTPYMVNPSAWNWGVSSSAQHTYYLANADLAFRTSLRSSGQVSVFSASFIPTSGFPNPEAEPSQSWTYCLSERSAPGTSQRLKSTCSTRPSTKVPSANTKTIWLLHIRRSSERVVIISGKAHRKLYILIIASQYYWNATFTICVKGVQWDWNATC